MKQEKFEFNLGQIDTQTIDSSQKKEGVDVEDIEDGQIIEEDEEDIDIDVGNTIEEKKEEDKEVSEYEELYNYYKDNNLITPYEDFDGTAESFQKAIEHTRNQEREYFFNLPVNSVPESVQPLIEYALNKGQNASLEEIKNIFLSEDREKEIDYDNIDEVKNHYTNLMLSMGIEKDLIEDEIDMYSDGQEEVLVKKVKFLDQKNKSDKEGRIQKEVEKAKEEKKRLEKAAEEQMNAIVSDLENREIPQDIKSEVYNMIVSGEVNEKINHINKNPKATNDMVLFLRSYNIETGEFDLENYKKSVFSTEAKKVKNKIEKNFKNTLTKKGKKKATTKKEVKYRVAID